MDLFFKQSGLESVPGQRGYLVMTGDGAIQQVCFIDINLCPTAAVV